MAIKKFTSFEEARRDQWVFSPDAEYYKRLRKFYRFAFRLSPPRSDHGIRKYRDISEATKREEISREAMENQKGRGLNIP